MKMEPSFCTAVFWRGGEKIDLNGQKPDAVRCLSVTGERKVNLSFLRDYPNLEELTLMEKCEGVEVLSELKQLRTLSLWLSAPVSWDNVSLPGLRVLHLRGEKNGDITPLLTSITYLHLEEMRKTEDLAPFLTPATRLQKLYLQSLPAVQELPALDGLPSLYALKLYELHTVTTCNVKGERVTIKKDKAKNKSSLRTYPLIPFLKERLLEAKKQQEENRKLCGRAYNKEYLGYVCVDVIGNLIKPNYVSSTFGKLLAKNNLRHIRFHDLRHTCASLLLANGVPMEQVKEWLGHSEISTTVDIYGHLQYATKKQSAAAIEQDIVAPMLQNLSAVSP